MTRYYCKLDENAQDIFDINYEYITFTDDFDNYNKINSSLFKFFSHCAYVIAYDGTKYNWWKYRNHNDYFDLYDQERLMEIILKSVAIEL